MSLRQDHTIKANVLEQGTTLTMVLFRVSGRGTAFEMNGIP